MAFQPHAAQVAILLRLTIQVRGSIDHRRMSAQEAALVHMIARAVSSHGSVSGGTSTQSMGFLAGVDSPASTAALGGGGGGGGVGAGAAPAAAAAAAGGASIDHRRMSAQEAALVTMIAAGGGGGGGGASAQSLGASAADDGGDGDGGDGDGGDVGGGGSQGELAAAGGDGDGDGDGSMEVVTEDAWLGFEQAVTEAYSRHDAAGAGRLGVGDAEEALSEVGVELQPGQLLQLLQQRQQSAGEVDATAVGAAGEAGAEAARVVTLVEVLEVLAMVLDLPAGDGADDGAGPDAPAQSDSAV